jgi:hypothetical protein
MSKTAAQLLTELSEAIRLSAHAAHLQHRRKRLASGKLCLVFAGAFAGATLEWTGSGWLLMFADGATELIATRGRDLSVDRLRQCLYFASRRLSRSIVVC